MAKHITDMTAVARDLMILVNHHLETLKSFAAPGFNPPKLTEENCDTWPLYKSLIIDQNPDQVQLRVTLNMIDDRERLLKARDQRDILQKNDLSALKAYATFKKAELIVQAGGYLTLEEAASYSRTQITSYRTKLSKLKVQTVLINQRACVSAADVLRILPDYRKTAA